MNTNHSTSEYHLPFGEELTTLHPDTWSAPFWVAAREHRLVAQQCADCGAFRMPPSAFCWRCRSQNVVWPDLPGTGTIFTFTISRHALTPAAADCVPYVIAVIELDGAPGIRLISNIVGVDVDSVEIGQRVDVVWDDVSAEVTIPRFIPIQG